MTNSSFGQWLKTQRQRYQITQATLGSYVGCAGETIRKIEANRTRPSAHMVERILQTLEVPESEHVMLSQWARTGKRPSTLPTPLTELLGRKDEMEEVSQLLHQPQIRLLTLTGPPGVGKTRLALAVATALERQLPYGVTYIPLVAVQQSTMVLSTIAYRLGVPETGQGSLFDRVTEQLQIYPRLLVLDNLEHLLNAIPMVSRLLESAPEVRILVTSRIVLQISGEHVYVVPPLPVSVSNGTGTLEEVAAIPAIQLFLQRVQARQPDCTLTSETAPLITTICQQLDGLPLAIELAAGRAQIASLSQIVQQLDTRLGLLINGTHGSSQHHQTLRTTLEWSYNLLPPLAQIVFRQLGIFVGGGTLKAITAICTIKQNIVGAANTDQATLIDILSTLIDHSLLQRTSDDNDDVPRYQMLETVREFAMDQLKVCDEYPETQALYSTYYLNLAETASPQLRGVQQQTWLHRLKQENPNLMSALQTAIDQHNTMTALRFGGALWRFWYLQSTITEAAKWLEDIINQSEGFVSPAHAQALDGAGWFAFLRGNYDQTHIYYTDCLTMAQSLNDQELVGRTLCNLGTVTGYQGQYDQAQTYFEQSIALFDQMNRQTTYVRSSLAGLMCDQGCFERAEELLQEALTIAHDMEDQHAIGLLLNNLSYVYAQRGEYQQAIATSDKSLHYRRQSGYRYGIASSIGIRGRIALLQGDLAYALTQLREALQMFRTMGALLACVECIEAVAEALGRQGQLLQAAQLWGAATHMREEIQSPLVPNERNHLQAIQIQLQAASDPEKWQTAWDSGRRLTLKQAVRLALDIPLSEAID